jgi:hypothetical protein
MIKKVLLFLTFCIVSFGAAQSQNFVSISKDGYYIESAAVRRTHFSVVFHPMKDQSELTDAWNVIYNDDITLKFGLKGFYVWDEAHNTCHIYVVNPITQYEPEYLGHEFTHCLYGNFHNDQSEAELRRDKLRGQ